MCEIPVDDPIFIDNIADLTKNVDFMDHIKLSTKKQSTFSAQGLCKFLVFNIRNHEINRNRWESIVVNEPQAFQFRPRKFDGSNFWQRVSAPEIPYEPLTYGQIYR